jgi:hypothetical protein
MPFYEYEHIPGIDWLGRNILYEVSPKQVGSVAAQLGKKQVISETYGCCGWDVTPQELKEIAECQYVSGVNLMCQHLLPYTEHGQRKRDYPAHYSDVNPWVRKNFKEFNDYFSLLGKILAESEEQVNTAMLHPIRSVYFDYKRENPWECIKPFEVSISQMAETFTEMQIPHHYLDETLLAKYGRVEGNKLIMGKCSYEYIVLPKIYTMDKTTEKLLHEFVNAGGRVLLTDEKPTYLEGEEYDYDYLESNVTWEEIASAQPYQAYSKGVRSAYRKDEEGNETNPNAGGCFAGITIDGNKLIYDAYVLSDVDEANPDQEQVITKIDEYAIKKTASNEDVEDTYLPTDPVGTIDQTIANFIVAIPSLIVTYIKMLLGGIL